MAVIVAQWRNIAKRSHRINFPKSLSTYEMSPARTMPKDWKADIIEMTEHPAARAGKIDASFFPPAAEEKLVSLESEQTISIPARLRSYLATSNGLEAQKGEIWPVLPICNFEIIRNECSSPHPWIRFGETTDFHYLISLGHSPSVYRYEKFGSNEEFFAQTFESYLEKVFRGEG